MPRGNLQAHLLMLGVVAVWGGTYPVIKVLLASLRPGEIALLRFAFAVPVFAAVLLAGGAPRIGRSDWLRAGAVALLAVCGYQLLLNTGQAHVTAAVASLILATGPIWTGLAASFALGERITLWNLGGLLLALFGIFLLVTDGDPSRVATDSLVGVAIMLGATFVWAAQTVLAKPLLAAHGSSRVMSLLLLAGSFALVPVGVTGATAAAPALGLKEWGLLAFLGTAATGLAYLAYYHALNRLTVVQTTVYLYLMPLFAILWSAIFLAAPVTSFILMGAGLVLVGVALTQWRVWYDAEARARSRHEEHPRG